MDPGAIVGVCATAATISSKFCSVLTNLRNAPQELSQCLKDITVTEAVTEELLGCIAWEEYVAFSDARSCRNFQLVLDAYIQSIASQLSCIEAHDFTSCPGTLTKA